MLGTFLITCYNINSTVQLTLSKIRLSLSSFFAIFVQLRFSLKFPYEHVKLFSLRFESSIVIG